jgi:hypothetical protein
MPLPVIALVVLGLGGVLTVAATFWADICEWYAEHANPWLEKHVPSLAPHLMKAFQFIDSNAMLPLRRAVKAAWSKVRPYIVEATVTFLRVDGEWVRRVDSYLQKKLGAGEQMIKRTEERAVPWDELPESVRDAALRKRSAAPIDFLKTRDREVLTLGAAS